jgi:hypothetical protein
MSGHHLSSASYHYSNPALGFWLGLDLVFRRTLPYKPTSSEVARRCQIRHQRWFHPPWAFYINLFEDGFSLSSTAFFFPAFLPCSSSGVIRDLRWGDCPSELRFGFARVGRQARWLRRLQRESWKESAEPGASGGANPWRRFGGRKGAWGIWCASQTMVMVNRKAVTKMKMISFF